MLQPCVWTVSTDCPFELAFVLAPDLPGTCRFRSEDLLMPATYWEETAALWLSVWLAGEELQSC